MPYDANAPVKIFATLLTILIVVVAAKLVEWAIPGDEYPSQIGVTGWLR